jgi:hypothetical protein
VAAVSGSEVRVFGTVAIGSDQPDAHLYHIVNFLTVPIPKLARELGL